MMRTLPCGNTFITINARDVIKLANSAIAEIAIKRNVAIRDQLRECMDEECVHRIPLLNIVYHRHKLYPDTAAAMNHALEIQHIIGVSESASSICEALKEFATWVIESSGIPDEKQMINLSLNDFHTLNRNNYV